MTSFNVVSKAEILKHLEELASDAYEGRASPSAGLDRAAQYIRDTAAAAGLVGINRQQPDEPFYQPFRVFGFAPLAAFRATADHRFVRRKPISYGHQLFESAVHEDEWQRRMRPAALPTPSFFEWGRAKNVVAVLEGSDPVLKDEYIILSAHYDHIGTRRSGQDRIFNGADDNASGAALLLGLMPALARLKAEGQGPKRSILFVWTAAEELGLLGADYYRRHPLVPLEKTMAAINVDMVARLSAQQVSVIDLDRAGHPNVFRNLVSSAAAAAGITSVNRDIDQYADRQDGGIWAEAGLASLCVFEGFTADGRLNPDYHGVDDEIAGILADNNGDKIVNVGNMVLSLLIAVADGRPTGVLP